MDSPEKRAYAKGYAAGRKFVETARSASARRRAEDRMWRDVFCAVLQGTIISSGWETSGKKWTASTDYIRGCGNIADEALKQHRSRA